MSNTTVISTQNQLFSQRTTKVSCSTAKSYYCSLVGEVYVLSGLFVVQLKVKRSCTFIGCYTTSCTLSTVCVH